MIDTETITTCSRHPKVKTALRCATCGTPICPDCLVQTPVGMKCKSCAAGASGTLFRPSILQAVLASAVGITAGSVAGWGVEFSIGLFTLFIAFVYGGFVGNMILKVSGRKRGIRMEIITAASVISGIIIARAAVGILVMSTVQPPLGIFRIFLNLIQPTPIPLAALIIVIAGAVSRIRYI